MWTFTIIKFSFEKLFKKTTEEYILLKSKVSFTCTPRIPKIIKNVQQITTI
jgi:hypothetical protein